MKNILDHIVESKKREIEALYQQFDFEQLRRATTASSRSFYQNLQTARERKQPFFIYEFKRKSPSEGWINPAVDLPAQVRQYAAAGASAVSVLTDAPFFGGSYADLKAAAQVLQLAKEQDAPLLLQKDFILDPIQIYLARQHGADIILLIAAILSPKRLDELRHIAEQLGMGVLVEVHNQEELNAVAPLDFPVLGINSRDLKTFRTALNRVNVLAQQAGNRFIIAESGIRDYRDFRVVRKADGFLIGTGLMQNPQSVFSKPGAPFLFKACGIRSSDLLEKAAADYLGINFSPVSRRRIDPEVLNEQAIPNHAVAVFYKNSEEEIRKILARYPFRMIQLYAGDVSAEFVRSLKYRVLLACRVRETADLEQLDAYAADVDLFILDGAAPGSGQVIAAPIPTDFPYPFLLAGGLHAGNLSVLSQYDNCIGVDIASGIETAGVVDGRKILEIGKRLSAVAG